MEEIWKKLEMNETYSISTFGRVRNDKTGYLKKPTLTYGYYFVRINNTTLRLHRLVASSFIPNIENKPHVNHINGIKTDNSVLNLEWVTRSENMIYAYENKLITRNKGINHQNNKLTEKEVLEIYYAEGNSNKIGNHFNVNSKTIDAIKNKNIWIDFLNDSKSLDIDFLLLTEIDLKDNRKKKNINIIDVELTIIPNFPNYMIDKSGNVFSIIRKMYISKHKNDDGYYRISIRNKKSKIYFLHILLATIFIPNPNNYPIVNHINGIRDDNRLENLEWCTYKENSKYGNYNDVVGENNVSSKLKKEEVIDIFTSNESCRVLMEKYNISHSPIYRIRSGIAWTHITKYLQKTV